MANQPLGYVGAALTSAGAHALLHVLREAVGQRALEGQGRLARALAGEPKLLLVDEVASGLSTVEIRKFVELIRQVRDRYGVTVIWVEHIFSALAQVVDRLVVLESGAVIADAAPLGDRTVYRVDVNATQSKRRAMRDRK